MLKSRGEAGCLPRWLRGAIVRDIKQATIWVLGFVVFGAGLVALYIFEIAVSPRANPPRCTDGQTLVWKEGADGEGIAVCAQAASVDGSPHTRSIQPVPTPDGAVPSDCGQMTHVCLIWSTARCHTAFEQYGLAGEFRCTRYTQHKRRISLSRHFRKSLE